VPCGWCFSRLFSWSKRVAFVCRSYFISISHIYIFAVTINPCSLRPKCELISFFLLKYESKSVWLKVGKCLPTLPQRFHSWNAAFNPSWSLIQIINRLLIILGGNLGSQLSGRHDIFRAKINHLNHYGNVGYIATAAVAAAPALVTTPSSPSPSSN